MNIHKVAGGVIGIGLIVVLAQLALIAGVIYTVVHFVQKFW